MAFESGLGMRDQKGRRLFHDGREGKLSLELGSERTCIENPADPLRNAPGDEDTAGCAEDQGQITREAAEQAGEEVQRIGRQFVALVASRRHDISGACEPRLKAA